MTAQFLRISQTGGFPPKFNSYRNVVLGLLVSAALYLCGCASGRLTLSTNNTQSRKPHVRTVDFSEVPELKELAERCRRIGNEMYPKVLGVLVDDTSKFPQQFDIVLKKHLKPNQPGWTQGKKIKLDAVWLEKNPDKLDAVLIHEMAHVTQGIHWYRGFKTVWTCWMEGLPDYVRYKLGDTNGWRCPQCSFECPHYTYGYTCAGAFLLFVDATYGSNVVRQLNTELRRRTYSDKFFAKVTGKSLEELWVQFQKTPAFMPVAAEVDKLYDALGYVNGKPPRNVQDRFKAYLKQQGQESHFVLTRGHARLEADWEQPGDTNIFRYLLKPVVVEISGETAKDILRVYAHRQYAQEIGKAGVFLVSLYANGQLPGIPRGALREFSCDFETTQSDCENYFMSTFSSTKDDDPAKYHYLVVQKSKDRVWTLQRAWRTGPDGRVIEEYPVR